MEPVHASIDPLRVALFLVILFSISRIHQHFSAIGQLRPALLLFFFCVLYVLLVPRSIDLRNLRDAPAPKAMAALAVLAVFSSLFGISLGNAATFFIKEYSRTLIFAFLIIVAIRSVRDLSLFIWAFIISAGVWIWLAFFIFEPVADTGSGGGIVRLSGLYTYDANDLGLVMMVTLPLTLLALQATRRKAAKIICFGTLLGIAMTTAMTGSRGAMVGLVGVGAALFFTLQHIPLARRVGLVGILAVALSVAAPPGYWQQMGSILEPTEDYNWSSVDGRRQVTLRGLGYMMSYPVFGIGVGNFSRAEGTISSKARNRIPGTGIRWTAAHNSYIQIGAEMGPLGLGLFLSLLWGGIVGVRRVRNRIPGSWERGDDEQRFLFYTCRYLPVAFVGFAVPALFVSFAYLTPFYFLVAFMTSFFLLLQRRLLHEGKQGVRVTPSVRPGWRTAGGRGGAPLGAAPVGAVASGAPGWRSAQGKARGARTAWGEQRSDAWAAGAGGAGEATPGGAWGRMRSGRGGTLANGRGGAGWRTAPRPARAPAAPGRVGGPEDGS